jgi:D-psicose/D-tagatose/L-ribulose 3-epimerase
MKLAVSNIAWGNADLAGHLSLLSQLGCDGVEIAPSLIWEEPVTAPVADRREFRRTVEGAGLKVVGFHSLLYTRPDLHILKRGSSEAAVEYMGGLAHLCADIGGGTLVFGSPRSRSRGSMSRAEAMDRAAAFFSECARVAQTTGMLFLIEALEAEESDFISSIAEAKTLVDAVGHPNFRLHLDARAMISSDEDVADICLRLAGEYVHVHVGDPGLAPPGSTGMDHRPLGRALRSADYQGFVSIEMRRGSAPSCEAIARSVEYVRNAYF